MWGKKSSIKSAKNRFLYSQKYREQKIGGKNWRNNFSRNTRIMRAKKVGRKIVGKSAKKRFLYSPEYHDQKMGTKNARNHFSRNTRIERAKNVGKKSL